MENQCREFMTILQDHATKHKNYYNLIVEWDLSYAQHDRFMRLDDLIKYATTTRDVIERMPNFMERWVYSWITSFIVSLYRTAISYDSLTVGIYGHISKFLHNSLYVKYPYGGSDEWDLSIKKCLKKK